jgi:hypothetical protein
MLQKKLNNKNSKKTPIERKKINNNMVERMVNKKLKER